MKIDIDLARPVLFNKFGGMSGKAIKPIAISNVYSVYEAVDVPIIGVIGNKCDLYLKEQVSESEGKKYAEEIGAKFIYTSAKLDAHNFKKFLEELVKDYVKKFGNRKISDIKINKQKLKDRKKRKCC